MKQTINKLAKTNKYEYNLLKAAEELQELSLILTQMVNKPNKVSEKNVTDEIGDVTIRLEILKKLFNNNLINRRIKYKINKFKTYLSDGKYKGKI